MKIFTKLHSLWVSHKKLWLCILSGILLILNFPGWNLGHLAWLSLVPFLFALKNCQTREQALKCGFTAGIIFFALSLHWLIYVSAFGWVFLSFLETAFLMLFALAVHEGRNIRKLFLRIFWIGLCWTATEFMRAEVPVWGLGWNLLAYSQADHFIILQSANTVGAYGLGFIIAFVNASLCEMLSCFLPAGATGASKESASSVRIIVGFFVLQAIIFAMIIAHGFYHLTPPKKSSGNIRVALIQGNIPQDLKWNYEVREKILEIYSKLTELSSFDQPDLIVWPEAAYPGYFNRDADAGKIQDLIKKIGIPALIGSPHLETQDIAFNSAYLLDAAGAIKGRYDKQFLVPFGEYVPMGFVLGWLKPLAYSLGVSDFSAGKKFTVFNLMNGDVSFSVLICFEDTFPGLARNFVDRGARFLAVITNDAWFGPTSAPHQHLQASIFRAVENGVPVVRAANTGVSAFSSAKGLVLDRIKDPQGKDIFVTGHRTLEIPIEDGPPTLYRRGGWIFPYAALFAFVIMFAVLKRNKKRK